MSFYHFVSLSAFFYSLTQEGYIMRLKIERVKRNLSQDDLSRLSGVSRATISKLEQYEGDYIPSVKVSKKLAEALQIDWHEFYITEGKGNE